MSSIRLAFPLVLLAAALSIFPQAWASPLIYRGSLTDRGEPAEGSYAFRLTFYQAQFGGAPLAPPTTLETVTVSDGAFSADLDLAAALQARDTLWLEVEVRDAAGQFVALAEREAVTPKALAGGVCWSVDGNTGTLPTSNVLGTTDSAALRIVSGGGVGINTPAPLGTLHVRSSSAGSITPIGGSSGVFETGGHTYLSVFSPAASERGILFGKPGGFNEAADGGVIYNNANTATLQFRTGANVTRMQLGVGDVDGTDPNSDVAETNLQLFGAGGSKFYLKPQVDGSLGPVLDIGTVGFPPQLRISIVFTQVLGDFNVTGVASKPGGGTWSASSDLRLKKNIVPLEGALDRLLALRGVNFEYARPDAAMHPAGVRTGFVAQEVQKVFPQWVTSGDDGYLMVGSQGFEALTVEALRQLAQENEQLHADNADLRARLDRVERLLSHRKPADD